MVLVVNINRYLAVWRNQSGNNSKTFDTVIPFFYIMKKNENIPAISFIRTEWSSVAGEGLCITGICTELNTLNHVELYTKPVWHLLKLFTSSALGESSLAHLSCSTSVFRNSRSTIVFRDMQVTEKRRLSRRGMKLARKKSKRRWGRERLLVRSGESSKISR